MSQNPYADASMWENLAMGASGVSTGASLLMSFLGPDINAENRQRQRANQSMIDDRMRQMWDLFGRKGEFFNEEMARLNPALAFADTQGRQAATSGARQAQAGLRRSLGSGGDIFAGLFQAGAATAATDRQNTLRALAMGEANQAVDRQIAMRMQGLQSMPFAFQGAYDPSQQQMRANLFANVGTALGGIGSNMQDERMKKFDAWNDNIRV